jgi:lipopolysaccharide export system permease protein
MRVLDRYIIKTILGSVALVAAVLAALLAMFLLIGEQGNVGTGHYGGFQALRYALLTLPESLFQLLPIAALMGSLLGMGTLAGNSELTIMRASGVSIVRIGYSVFLAGACIFVLTVIIGEFIAPPLGQMARAQRAFDRYSNISYAGRGGAWVRDGNLILKAEQQSGDGAFGGFTVFDVSAANRLLAVGRAVSASQDAARGWTLRDYAQSRFAEHGVAISRESQHVLDTRVTAAFLGVASTDPIDLSMRELHRSIRYLRSNHQATRPYRFAFWARAARAAAIPFAVLLALPFLFGSLRASGNGARATLGLVLGLGYFILQRMVESGTIAFSLDPMLLAWLPTIVLAVAVASLIARVRA